MESNSGHNLDNKLNLFEQEDREILESSFAKYKQYEEDAFQLVEKMQHILLNSSGKLKLKVEEQLKPKQHLLVAVFRHNHTQLRLSMRMRAFLLEMSLNMGKDIATGTLTDEDARMAEATIARGLNIEALCTEVGELCKLLAKPLDPPSFIEPFLDTLSDPERRATLQLRFSIVFPQVLSRCCKVAHCFKCKTRGHEGPCEANASALDNTIKQCAQCGVSVVKGDGCNSLRCVCGHSFSWA